MKPSDPNWHSFVEEPLIAEKPDAINWDDTADVVVVGFGGAGATVAIEARQQGATVHVLERFQGGGATMLSGGVIYAGGGTKQQKAAGLDDDPDNMFRYLQTETEGCVSDELLREFCETSVENMEWLEDLGLEFPGNQAPEKTSYPMNPYFLYYSGNEGIPERTEIARPVPRGHRHKSGGQAGTEFYLSLKAAALKAGVNVSTQTKVTRLVTDVDGRVIGVEALRMDLATGATKRHALIMKVLSRFHATATAPMAVFSGYLEKLEARASSKYMVRARKGVALASGGFICNSGMTDHYLPKYGGVMRNGTPGCDGSGIRLGQSVGGATRQMERASAWRFINPPKAFAQGAIVNASGERYCNEGAYGAQVGYHMCEHKDGVGWIILDSKLMSDAKRQVLPWKVLLFQTVLSYMTIFANTKKGATLEELAKNTGFDPETFKNSIDTYNKAARGDIPDPMRKGQEFLVELSRPPYYALNISKDSSTFPLAVLTFGGLTVDEQTRQVQREDGSSVNGLYAIGRTAASLPSNHYMSGFAIADCVFTGRKAGRAVVSSIGNL